MKKTIVSFIALSITILLNSGASFAVKNSENPTLKVANEIPQSAEPAKTMEQKNAELEAKLKFTPAQRKKSRAIRLAEQKESCAIEKQIKEKQDELTQIQESKFEFGKVRAKKAQKAKLKNEILELEQKKTEVSEKYIKQYDAMLNAKQKAQIEKIREEHKALLNCSDEKKKK